MYLALAAKPSLCTIVRVEKLNELFELAKNFVTSLANVVFGGCRLKDLKCLLLKTIPSRGDVERAVHTIQEHCATVVLNEDKYKSLMKLLLWERLFHPSCMNGITLYQIFQFCGRRNEALKHFRTCQVPHSCLLKLAGLVLCLPGSYTSVKRVFSLINYLWNSGKKSQFKVTTTTTMLTVRTHFNLSCAKFSSKLSNTNTRLKKTHSSEKSILRPKFKKWKSYTQASEIPKC